MTEPTEAEALALEGKFMNARMREAAGFTEATETERPNFEMNRIIRRAAGQPTEENENG